MSAPKPNRSIIAMFKELKEKFRSWKSTRRFKREMLRAFIELEEEKARTPMRSLYVAIPSGAAPWPNQGIKLDDPEILLPWGKTADEIGQLDHGLHSESGIRPVKFLGYAATWLNLRISQEHANPHYHPKTLCGCSVNGFPRTDVGSAYHDLRARLEELLGPPTQEIGGDDGYGHLQKVLLWDLAYVIVEHRETDGWAQMLEFRRKYLPEYESRIRKEIYLDWARVAYEAANGLKV